MHKQIEPIARIVALCILIAGIIIFVYPYIIDKRILNWEYLRLSFGMILLGMLYKDVNRFVKVKKKDDMSKYEIREVK